ncbi:AsnC family transcriptional regulator [Psychromonas sp. B3M02]|uniref:Lrp/AsnC family transcriptional regulator n=1 Tax=Psychromonas sp. B3M02 TaxID=2267226 RepID=UPI000DE808D8|nr:Lrp/AsnC family transcriptional regulator [Psychromonas sp. B3M02]RBW44931.1 AsnC family transcriptional regulator [Psychromonas sp. B3M02]
MNKLDHTDKKLLALLRKDARMPVVNLSKALGVSRATVQNRLNKLEREGVILGYTVKLKQEAQQDAVRVLMSLLVEAKEEEKIIESLRAFPEIVSVYHTNGQWDLIADIQVDSISVLGGLLGEIRAVKGIIQTETSLLLGLVF